MRSGENKTLGGTLVAPLCSEAFAEPISFRSQGQNRTRIEKKGDKIDKRGIERVSFASVHSLGAAIVAQRSESASTDKKGNAALRSTSQLSSRKTEGVLTL